MPTEWPLRQPPEAPVIIARNVLADAGRLAFVVLDDDGDWFVSDGTEPAQEVVTDREQFCVLSLRETLDLLPELASLAELPPGMAADWDAERRTWLLSSVAGSDDDAEDRAILAARREAWPYDGRPDDEAQISTGLTEIPVGSDAPPRAVRQVVREPDGSWLFVGFEVPEATEFEVEGLDLEHIARLYPDVKPVLMAAPGQVYDRAEPGATWEIVEG